MTMSSAVAFPARPDRVVLIYNPDSAGTPLYFADQLHSELEARLPGLPVSRQPTDSAGHARALAREAAREGQPLIISVSGDGGFHEVVNGIMDAGNDQASCAVLAAGNANDHRRSTRRLPLIDAIVHGEARRIDLLRVTLGSGPAEETVYAHSYIGFGLTPMMAIGIDDGKKGRITELLSVSRSLAGLKPVELTRADGARATFDSLILANIGHIAKYGKLSEAREPDDGFFEVITLPPAGLWRMALMTLRAVTIGLGDQPSVSRYEFITIDPIPFQMDGEVMQVGADTPVLVESIRRSLTVFG